MIALTVNNYVWNNLRLDTVFDAKYDKYRATYGANFIPFFPVADNLAGDASWGSECYVLYDPMTVPPRRSVYAERRETILYTLVGPLPELFEFKEAIIDQFDSWSSTSFANDGYRVNDINAWQTDQTRVRDKLRQLYSLTLMVEVNYIKC
jgi:hypothetical protein